MIFILKKLNQEFKGLYLFQSYARTIGNVITLVILSFYLQDKCFSRRVKLVCWCEIINNEFIVEIKISILWCPFLKALPSSPVVFSSRFMPCSCFIGESTLKLFASDTKLVPLCQNLCMHSNFPFDCKPVLCHVRNKFRVILFRFETITCTI